MDSFSTSGYAPEDALLIQQDRAQRSQHVPFLGQRVGMVTEPPFYGHPVTMGTLPRETVPMGTAVYPSRRLHEVMKPQKVVCTEAPRALKERSCGSTRAPRRVLWVLISFVCALVALVFYDVACHCDTSVSVTPLDGGHVASLVSWQLVLLSRFTLAGSLVFAVMASGRAGTDALIIGVVLRLIVTDFLPVAIFLYRYFWMRVFLNVDAAVTSGDVASVCSSMCRYISVITYIRSVVFGV